MVKQDSIYDDRNGVYGGCDDHYDGDDDGDDHDDGDCNDYDYGDIKRF